MSQKPSDYWGLNRNDFAMLYFVLEYRWIEIGIQEKNKFLPVDVEKNERRNREEEKDEKKEE